MAAIRVFDLGGQLSGDQIDVYDSAMAKGQHHGSAFWEAAYTPIHRAEPAPVIEVLEDLVPDPPKLSWWARCRAKFGF